MKKLQDAEKNLRLCASAREQISTALEAERTKKDRNKIPMRLVAATAAVVLTATLLTVGVLRRPATEPTAESTQSTTKAPISGESLQLCITQMRAGGQSSKTNLELGKEIFAEPCRRDDGVLMYAFQVVNMDDFNQIDVVMRGMGENTSPDEAVTNSGWRFEMSDEESEKSMAWDEAIFGEGGAEDATQKYVVGYYNGVGEFSLSAPADGETVVYAVTAESDTEYVCVDLRLRAVDGKIGVTVDSEKRYTKNTVPPVVQ